MKSVIATVFLALMMTAYAGYLHSSYPVAYSAYPYYYHGHLGGHYDHGYSKYAYPVYYGHGYHGHYGHYYPAHGYYRVKGLGHGHY